MTKVEEIFYSNELNNSTEISGRIINTNDGNSIRINLLPCYYMENSFINDEYYDAGIGCEMMETGEDICDNIIDIRKKMGSISMEMIDNLVEAWPLVDSLEDSDEYLNICPFEKRYEVKLAKNAVRYYISEINDRKISTIRCCNEIISKFYQIIDPCLYDFAFYPYVDTEFPENCDMYFSKEDYLKVKEIYDLTSRLEKYIKYHFSRSLPERLEKIIPYVYYPHDAVTYMNEKLNAFRKVLEDIFNFDNMDLDK